MIWSAPIAALALSATVLGHAETEQEHRAQAATLRRIAAHAKRSLAACADSPAAVALRQRAVARRAVWADELRGQPLFTTQHERRGKEEFERWMAVSHDQTPVGYDLDTPLDDIFASNASCILVPQSVIGPYYVAGEYLRKDISEAQPGVAAHFDFQFVDVSTCEAVPDLIVDLWHANATGVYSGITDMVNQGGSDTNFGRGVQITDGDGVVQYSTIFPGHYLNRTNHMHVMSTKNATVLSNGTFEGGIVSHIGQAYFDQSLVAAVEANPPYSWNEQPLTDNKHDRFSGDAASADYDPFLRYVRLGRHVQDGLLLWITIGIDTTANYNGNVSVAAHWHPAGGTDEKQRKHA